MEVVNSIVANLGCSAREVVRSIRENWEYERVDLRFVRRNALMSHGSVRDSDTWRRSSPGKLESHIFADGDCCGYLVDGSGLCTYVGMLSEGGVRLPNGTKGLGLTDAGRYI